MRFPKILHSVSYSGSWGQAFLPLESFVDKAADLGFEGVLLMAKRPHLSLLDYGAAERLRLRQKLESRGMRHVAVAGYNNFTADMEHRDIPTYEIQVQYLTELARLTHDIGGSLLRVFTAYEHPAAGYTAQYDLVVKALKECARRSADLGVMIGVQNHHDIAVGYEAHYDLIRAVDEPNCRALFDAWAPALHGVDIAEAARKMGSITAHTTIANYQPRPRFRYEAAVVNYVPQTPYMQAVRMADGFIDYARFLGALSQSGFSGTVAYEMCSPLLGGGAEENLDEYARSFQQFMDGLRQHTSAAVS